MGSGSFQTGKPPAQGRWGEKRKTNRYKHHRQRESPPPYRSSAEPGVVSETVQRRWHQETTAGTAELQDLALAARSKEL